MNLIESVMEDFVLLDKSRTSDGYGGYTTTWVDSLTFKGAMTFDTSIEARRAAQEGVTSTYTMTTKKNMVLNYDDRIRRISDNKLFSVTSDGEDKKTPVVANLDMRQVTCEELSNG